MHLSGKILEDLFRQECQRPPRLVGALTSGKSPMDLALDAIDAENARRRDEYSEVLRELNDPGDTLWWQLFMRQARQKQLAEEAAARHQALIAAVRDLER
jgi:hypothetical protein